VARKELNMAGTAEQQPAGCKNLVNKAEPMAQEKREGHEEDAKEQERSTAIGYVL